MCGSKIHGKRKGNLQIVDREEKQPVYIFLLLKTWYKFKDTYMTTEVNM